MTKPSTAGVRDAVGEEKVTVFRAALPMIVAASFAMSLVPETSVAAYPRTDADFAVLPPFCKARIGASRDEPEYKHWQRRLGGDFLHVHHYCAGLHTENLGFRSSNATTRKNLWRQAVREFEYVENQANPQFVLMPEVLVRKGKLLAHLGRPDDALGSFRKAMQLNPKYNWSYIAAAEMFIRNEQPEKAREVLEAGLAAVPPSQAKGLRRIQDELREAVTEPGAVQAQ